MAYCGSSHHGTSANTDGTLRVRSSGITADVFGPTWAIRRTSKSRVATCGVKLPSADRVTLTERGAVVVHTGGKPT